MKTRKTNATKMLLGFLAMAIMLGACNPKPKKEAEPQMTTAVEKVIKTPGDIISLDEADSLYVNYTRRRAIEIMKDETIEEGKPFKPVRFVSFDLETIKDYIAYVEQEAEKGGTKADSLRIYLGNYGSRAKEPNNRHNTIFMLPSAKAEGGYGGIYIGDDGKAKLIKNYFANTSKGKDNGEKSKASLMPNLNASLMQGGESLILNYGNCCPPKNGDF